MEWSNDDTWLVSKYVAGTRFGIRWIVRFLWDAHEEIVLGVYDETAWVQKFRDGVLRQFSSMFDGEQKIGVPNMNPESIDWIQLYHHCLELSKPRPGAFE